jgi:hypothetical protein
MVQHYNLLKKKSHGTMFPSQDKKKHQPEWGFYLGRGPRFTVAEWI